VGDKYPLASRVKIVDKTGTRGTGTVVGEDNKAPSEIYYGDNTETVMLNFSIEGSGDVITIDIINITHGGSGQFGDCTVYIYNETGGSTLGEKDTLDELLGSEPLTGAVTPINIGGMDIGPDYKAYLLITVIFDTDVNDVGTDHFINITDAEDFWLNSTQDDITGTFPLVGGPTLIVPEFGSISIPLMAIIAFYLIFQKVPMKKKYPESNRLK
jgi:hypothetical protein